MRIARSVIVITVLGCSGADGTAMVRMQAARDFVCAESTVDVHKRVDGSYSAVGCGKSGRYQAICEGVRCSVSKQGEETKTPPSMGLMPESRVFEP